MDKLIFQDDFVCAPKSTIIAHECLRQRRKVTEDEIFMVEDTSARLSEEDVIMFMDEINNIVGLCHFDLNDHRRLGRIVKRNSKTVWVSIVFGANTRKVIKRHIVKHHVTFN